MARDDKTKRAEEELRLARLLHRRAESRSDTEEVRRILRRNAKSLTPEYIERLWQEYNDLLRLLEINLDISAEHNLSKLLDKSIDTVIEVINAERGYLILLDRKGDLRFEVARGIDHREPDAGLPPAISRSITRRTIETGRAVITNNAEEDARFADFASVQDFQLRSIMCAPLKIKEDIIGALYVDNRSIKGNFSQKDLDLLETICAQAAIAIENAQLVEDNLKQQRKLLAAKEEVELLNKQLAEKVQRQSHELAAVRRSLERSQMCLETKYNYDNIIGRSEPLQRVFRLLDRTTETDVPVLIQGESGTGKELVARAIHFNGPRKSHPFISENASSISESLFESELFGHVKGAFTGAVSDRKGLFELADKGTLFLDEIGDLSMDMQSKLLRVIENGEIRRVGGKDIHKVDVRIITATNKDPAALVKQGLFREDLYYRLNVVKIVLPPLRERREDIPLLAEHFLKEHAEKTGTPLKALSPEASAALAEYDWPGNVRELENEICRLAVLSASSPVITPEFVSPHIRNATPSSTVTIPEQPRNLHATIEEIEKRIIVKTLNGCGGNKSKSARILGLSRDGLRKKMLRYGINTTGGEVTGKDKNNAERENE
ncbi:MAG: sigma-54-dependent Fis family transcriptional regulator [Planctomycetota bacterium]|nr:MAG: sigma-54-dependent Fis family transcriptional regulator [Planctomycetota bacterium]